MLDAGIGNRQIFRHGATQFSNGFPDLLTNGQMNLIGFLLSLNIVATQLFLSLSSAKQVGCQFGRAHVVQNLLTLFQTFSLVNGFLIKSAVQAK
ncbi:hypothetical protein ACIOZM_30340 [Pseudomonas sp. NPDC087346]|uniref:hypothetical protein n=1 Tax=Pseudomonas sp. NPDC087346 TaxID=3364438 RepID=UPI003812452F